MTSQYASHIARIEISSLWNGRKPIDWVLRPDVNVLSGKNGAGKSTILARLVQRAGVAAIDDAELSAPAIWHPPAPCTADSTTMFA